MSIVKWGLRVIGVLMILIVVFIAYIACAYWTTLPKTEGEVRTYGNTASVRIVRDTYGVPHVFASRAADVYFGLGYAHAQDRFFQMDLTRRSISGRLSELAGDIAYAEDVKARTMDWAATIKAWRATVSPETLAALQAYTAGVNARLAEGSPSPEYALLFTKPEPWRLEDTLACGIALVYDQVDGEAQEAVAQWVKGLTPKQKAEFSPPYPDWAPLQIPDGAPKTTTYGQSDEPHPGSNAWTVSGAHSATGKPLLASDPHISHGVPATFYLAHLAMPDGDVMGASLPGTPFFVLGRGPHAAWAITNGEIDAVDFITYPKTQAQHWPVRKEIIRVRGISGYENRLFAVVETPDGPVLNGTYFRDVAAFGPDVVVAVKNAAKDKANKVMEAMFTLPSSRQGGDVVRAARLMRAPAMNIILSSDNGDIGYALSGALPLRDAAGKWAGTLPEADRPISLNPSSGQLISANNQPANTDKITGDFTPYRAQRIAERLGQTSVHDMASFANIQRDLTSVSARRLLAAIRSGAPRTDAGQRLQRQLSVWDAVMSPDKAEPLYFAAWARAVSAAIYADEIGPKAMGRMGSIRVGLLDVVLTGGAGQWCDDIRTLPVETCPQIVGAALDAVAAAPPAGTWGKAHAVQFTHPLLSALPVIGGFYTIEQPLGGDGSTLAVSHYRIRGDFKNRSGLAVGYRAVYDLSDLDRSRYMIAPGQSEHPFSPHFRDLLPLWARGEGIEISGKWRSEPPPAGFKTLTLKPRQTH
jgi:penicillin G amidase